MKIKHKYGLLLVDIALTWNEKNKVIENMVVDTGAARTLIFKVQLKYRSSC
ncbi:hypothetical protein M3202_16225 [Alkalihalobacillus oceani]|uniref:Uncharacterized protein n=1 Tax=Halalkalibacter oceani TaxID=1653776 RepID=A0A9X2DRB9_9BACI|nr:hypothetical protein [Halalkalibacter oceani]MCM3715614.1 hypothetical protein [Halalkalibacter oceani]